MKWCMLWTKVFVGLFVCLEKRRVSKFKWSHSSLLQSTVRVTSMRSQENPERQQERPCEKPLTLSCCDPRLTDINACFTLGFRLWATVAGMTSGQATSISLSSTLALSLMRPSDGSFALLADIFVKPPQMPCVPLPCKPSGLTLL